jgi:hypothetical protein
MNNDFDKDEWGNIELPGLSDEELHSYNWNKSKTKAQKKAITKQWEEYWAVPGNREAWHNAVLEGQDEEWLAKVTAKNKAQGQDPVWLAKITEINRQRGANLTDEQRARMSEHSRTMWEDDEYRERMIKEAKERWEDPETRERMIAYTKVPGYSEMMSQRCKEVAQRPEMQEWYKEFNKAKREDPEHVKRHAEGVDKRSKTKEWRDTIKRNTIMTPDGEFESRKAAAEFYNIKPPVINYRMKKYPDQYYYTNVTNGSTIKYSKKTNANKGKENGE